MLLERAVALGRAIRSVTPFTGFLQYTSLECTTEPALLHRLHSHLSASTSTAVNVQQAGQQHTSVCPSSDASHLQQTQSTSSCVHSIVSQEQPALHLQQQQQQQQQLHHHHFNSSSSSSWRSPWAFSSSRGYADSAGLGRRRRMAGGYQGSSVSGLQAGMSPRVPLGRRAELCQSTESLRQPFVPSEYDAWKDRDRDTLQPLQVDGVTRGYELEAVMLMRQQVENSALPSPVKRSHLITGPAWDELLLRVNRTVKVTKAGKVETLHALVAVGNADGLIGIGEHSGKNVQKVAMDAQLKAYRNLVAIPRYRQHTVYHPIDYQKRKVRMRVWPRPSGFGITASPLMTQLCELAGINDVTIKLTGRRKNIRHVVFAFVEALSGQSLPHDGVEGSGVYMREVYYRDKLPCGLKRGVDIP